jgi:hypothetical protein
VQLTNLESSFSERDLRIYPMLSSLDLLSCIRTRIPIALLRKEVRTAQQKDWAATRL